MVCHVNGHERSLVLKRRSGNSKIPTIARSEEIRAVELMDCFFFLYLMAVLLLLTVIAKKNSGTLWHLVIHIAFFGMGVLVLWLNTRYRRGLFFFTRVWYIPFLYVFLFEEVGQMINSIQPKMFDPWVLGLEAKAFGGYPTVWLQSLANPLLTEFMSLFYMSYYFLIPVLGLILYFQQEWERLHDFLLTVSVTFFFCFLHYLSMPVAGPIFIPKGLPFELASLNGGPFTLFEQWLFFKGAIKGGAFPSSHVAVAVVVLLFAIRSGKYPYIFSGTVTGLAISTVYNGYHYGIDVIYGAIAGLLFSLACPLLNRAWKKRSTGQKIEKAASNSTRHGL